MDKRKPSEGGIYSELDTATKIHHLTEEITREEQLAIELKKQGRIKLAESYEAGLPKKRKELLLLLEKEKKQ